jgi:hypothetical protein
LGFGNATCRLPSKFSAKSNHQRIANWVWVNTYRYIFSGMNIHLPAILGFTRYQGFDPSPTYKNRKSQRQRAHMPAVVTQLLCFARLRSETTARQQDMPHLKVATDPRIQTAPCLSQNMVVSTLAVKSSCG